MAATQQKLNVAIVGGGVCGLTLAIALQRQGIKAHIFEAASKFGEIGAGLGIGANALKILQEIGVYDEVAKYMPDPTKLNMPGIHHVSSQDGHELIHNVAVGAGGAAAAIHRASFLDALVKFVDPTYTHFQKRCVSITAKGDSGGMQVIRFTDGTTAEADVVLVANGIKSSVRGLMMGNTGVKADAQNAQTNEVKGVCYSNTACYRGLVTQDRAKALGVDVSMWTYPTNIISRDKHIIVYPINKGQGQLVNVVAFVSEHMSPLGSVMLPLEHPTTETVTTQQLLDAYPGPEFSKDARALLSCIEEPSKWYINIVYPHLDTYARGRVALLGDAAHGMLPHLGAGAGQGIEDAYLLAQLLGDVRTTADNVEMVLQVYSDVRRPRSQRILDHSVRAGLVYDGYGPSGFTKEGLAQDLREIEGWVKEVYDYTLGNDVAEAREILAERSVYA